MGVRERETVTNMLKTLVYDEEMRTRIYNFDFSFDGVRGISDKCVG